MVIRLPYEWVEFIFGETIAQNFNEINAALLILGLICYLLFPRKKKKKNSQKKPDSRPVYIDQNENGRYTYKGADSKKIEQEAPIQEMYFGQYDRYSELTDEELRLVLQTRAEKKEPTYEEWKAAREKETQKQAEQPEPEPEPEQKQTHKVKPRKIHPEK